ncbi:MAG: hypothetical protein DMG40_25195 [Acidobacteria bacterium]|nr:MAG: hypothetical protein DMG40_25195 [Acidobacteriota bacterium]
MILPHPLQLREDWPSVMEQGAANPPLEHETGPTTRSGEVRRGFLHGVACSYVSFVIATQAKYGIQPE